MFALICKACLCIYVQFLQLYCNCLHDTFLAWLHIIMKRDAITMHLHSLAGTWLTWLSGMVSYARSLMSKGHLWCKHIVQQVLMSHLGNEVGSQETKRNNYKHGSAWFIPYIIHLPSVVIDGSNVLLVVLLITPGLLETALCCIPQRVWTK